MGIIGTIFIGLIVGLLARFLKPGDDSMGWIMTILLGIGGSVAAGFIGQAFGWYQPGEGAGWIGSVLGAVIVGVFITGLSLAGVDDYWQKFAAGCLVIIAVALDQWLRRASQ